MKNEIKITPGEWHAVEYAGYMDIQTGPYYGDKSVLNIEKVGSEQFYANSKLIETSPQLLKAAEYALMELQLLPCKCDPKAIQLLEEAINKATF